MKKDLEYLTKSTETVGFFFFLIQNFRKGKLDEEKVNIPIMKVTVFPLKELRTLSHRYIVARLSSETERNAR